MFHMGALSIIHWLQMENKEMIMPDDDLAI